MTEPTARAGLPRGRYGRSAGDDARTDRRLKIIGGVLGAVLVGALGWAGAVYIAGQPVSGELTGFQVLSDTEVEARIAVRKPADVAGVCTVRSQAPDGLEVGRADFRFDDDTDRIHRAVVLRTTQRATSAELIGCAADPEPR
ncbi:DUF4307 domain-containing protein [Streptomyces sp. ACA25]|uniref:DUF4307 domain-containing protein n=1 Tax=Streptomyces sp. ACA25 TaxID=3022596 RepID=UPI002306DF94|nr:DUF4307 domain-containing protein [Streptomyces sp. ACA25]MDB1087007.1 DUF4307 domain-containing protein [Streptomyces sp. ACA25]